jgi:hypothetical protein
MFVAILPFGLAGFCIAFSGNDHKTHSAKCQCQLNQALSLLHAG